MKSKRNMLLLALLLVTVLLLAAACAKEIPAEAVPALELQEQQQEKPQVEEKTSEASEPQEQIAATTPSEPTPEAKPTEVAPQTTPEQAATKQEDKVSLQLEGSGIEKSITLSLDELKAMKDSFVEDDFFSLNSYGTKEYFHFKGVKLNAIIQKAGLKKEAAAITVIASDGYKLELAIEQALKEDYIDEQDPAKKYPVIIAWHENGQDYDAAEGYPFRLVMGQKEPGDVNKPQWVMNIAKITVN